MNNSIFLPQTINVGFQSRRDTYTGKLSHICMVILMGLIQPF
jgi:hypothetical protein